MDLPMEKVFKLLGDLERAAEDLMTDKRTVIDLDRRRNDNRVALRQLGKSKEKKSWIVMGNTFFRLDTPEVKSVIEKDQKETDEQINKLRDGMKEKMEKIYDIEGKSMLKGFDLKPLNAEVKAMLPDMKFL